MARHICFGHLIFVSTILMSIFGSRIAQRLTNRGRLTKADMTTKELRSRDSEMNGLRAGSMLSTFVRTLTLAYLDNIYF